MSRRKEKNKITKIRNQRGGIIVELIEIKNYYKVPVLPQYIKWEKDIIRKLQTKSLVNIDAKSTTKY